MDHEDIDRSNLGKGEYVNYFEVAHDFVSFYVNFGQSVDARTLVYYRIITSPIGARRLAEALGKQLNEYSSSFGEIRDEEGRICSDDEL